ncbi:hypothetical protein HOLleu_16329 [Holothuria leucospilota]|uniref:Uncharacterized protein n=1 Tax=Holothuria leucospilota TaxID=206669 RepID=A0A9Q1C5W2_HOLLE|nr:hypothetical protein HOLleu_16329 [Holothuria leucospilota]
MPLDGEWDSTRKREWSLWSIFLVDFLSFTFREKKRRKRERRKEEAKEKEEEKRRGGVGLYPLHTINPELPGDPIPVSASL